MSLLLDALKRAEQEKQARQGQRDAAPRAAAAKPTLELAPVAGVAAAAATPRGAASPPPAPPSGKPAASASVRPMLWVAGAAIVLVVLLAGGYVWYSIDSLTPRPVARVAAPRPVAQAAVTPAPVAPAPLAQTEVLSGPPAARPATRARATEPRAEEAPAAVAPPTASAAILQPSRAAERPRIAPEVAAGYEALRRGDLASARRNYSSAHSADASSLDAALGLATVEARGGNRDLAAVLYRRALDIDPRNATALAGLAALSDPARPELLEPQLLRDIAHNPNAAPLHFMLGNLHASQSQWGQAQAAYFEAHRLDPGNPDIAHNLAVSLDRLGQARVAASFYQRALDASRTQTTQFDAAAVTKRLAELKDAPPGPGAAAAR